MTASQPAPLPPDTPAPAVTEGDVRALSTALAAFDWREEGDSRAIRHMDHQFHGGCGICSGDVSRIAAAFASLDAARVEVAGLVERVRVVEGERDAARRERDNWACWSQLWSGRAESAEAAHAKALTVAEGIAYEHAATVDGEFGCCHDEDALRAGGRVPEFDGEEFEPIPDDCLGKQTLDRHLRLLAESTGAGR